MAFGSADTATELANLALDALGETKRLLNVETDGTAVAKVMQSVFWVAWDETLAGYPWNCARKRARLAAMEQTPAFGFEKYYALPADFLGVQEIDGVLEGEQWAIELAGTDDAPVLALACDIPAPLDLVFTCRLRNLAVASASLKGAFIHALAFRAAMGVTGDSKKRDAQFAIWEKMLGIGQRADGRMMARRVPPDSAVITVRD